MAGNVNLPYGIQMTMNSSFISRRPFNPVVPVDLSGTGVTGGSLLPGLNYNCANMGCIKDDLAKAVASFNTTYAGTKAPNGTTIPKLTLPASYDFSQSTISQDIRLTKKFTYKERYSLSILGQVFNAFNIRT